MFVCNSCEEGLGNLKGTRKLFDDYEGRIKLDSGWRLVQEAQMRISRHVPNVYTVVSKDICETDDIHPQTKDQLAVRIAEAIKAHFFEG